MDTNRNSIPTPLSVGLTAGVVAVVVLAEGWLAFALAEQAPDRAAGGLLLAAGLLTGAAAVAALRRAAGARPLVLAAAIGLLVAGPAAAALTAATGPVFAADLLVLGALPVAGSLVLLAVVRRGISGAGRGSAQGLHGRS